MTRISSAFADLGSRGEAALIAYMMAGYPSERGTLDVLRGIVRGGADIIEIGFPFSDPLADGPVIQDAASASIDGGMRVAGLFSLVKKIRTITDVPLVLMTYANILYSMGYAKFIRRAAAAGIDGFIIPDMPVEESAEYVRCARDANTDAIFLASPNTPAGRLGRIAASSTGFLYLVGIYGTTGGRAGIRDYTLGALERARAAAGHLPVGVGFGVSTPADVRRLVRAGAGAVIVGSALVRLAGTLPPGRLEAGIARLTASLKEQTRPAGSRATSGGAGARR